MEIHSTDLIAGLGYLALGTRLKRIGEALQLGVGEALAAHRFSVQPAHIPLLIALRRSGGMTVGELAVLLGQSQPGISRGLSDLAERNLIKLSPGRDRRVRTARLTENGVALMDEIERIVFPRVRAAAEALCAGLDGGLLKQLGELDHRLARMPFAQRIEWKA